jgi:hypothetical protein
MNIQFLARFRISYYSVCSPNYVAHVLFANLQNSQNSIRAYAQFYFRFKLLKMAPNWESVRTLEGFNLSDNGIKRVYSETSFHSVQLHYVRFIGGQGEINLSGTFGHAMLSDFACATTVLQMFK